MKPYLFLIATIIFFSCAEKKKQATAPSEDTTTSTVVVAKKEICKNGLLPLILDSVKYPSPIGLNKNKDLRTLRYLLANNDTLTVKMGSCETPSYEYIYSTKRYYRGIDEIKFYYGAVNSFYLMLDKEHTPGTYLHSDLIEASKIFLKMNKKPVLKTPILFTSEGRTWTYTLEELQENGERRTMRWTVK